MTAPAKNRSVAASDADAAVSPEQGIQMSDAETNRLAVQRVARLLEEIIVKGGLPTL